MPTNLEADIQQARAAIDVPTCEFCLQLRELLLHQPGLLHRIHEQDATGHVFELILKQFAPPNVPGHGALCMCAASYRHISLLVRQVLTALWDTCNHADAINCLLPQILRCNPEASREQLASGLRFKRSGRLRDWDLRGCKLERLPIVFGTVRTTKDLLLSQNWLTTLPESMGNVRVGGDLHLNNNCLERLPKSFGKIKVRGDLVLHSNELTSLPQSMGKMIVGGDLFLSYNKIQDLPEWFSAVQVSGDLHLNDNRLASRLPDSFESVQGDVHLSDQRDEHGSLYMTHPADPRCASSSWRWD